MADTNVSKVRNIFFPVILIGLAAFSACAPVGHVGVQVGQYVVSSQIRSAITEMISAEDYQLKLTSNLESADEATASGDYDRALERYGEALRGYEQKEDPAGQVFCLRQIAWLLRFKPTWGQAVRLLEKAKPLAVKVNGDAAEIDADLGVLYLSGGDFLSAEKVLTQALRTVADVRFPLDPTFWGKTDNPDAAQIQRKMAARHHAETTLAYLYFQQGAFPRAVDILTASDTRVTPVIEFMSKHQLAPERQIGLQERLAFGRILRGVCYSEMEDIANARKFLEAGQELYRRAGLESGRLLSDALSLRLAAKIQSILESEPEKASFVGAPMNPAEVENRAQRLLAEADSRIDPDIAWGICFYAAKIHSHYGEFEKAAGWLKKAVDRLETIDEQWQVRPVRPIWSAGVSDVYADLQLALLRVNRAEEGYAYLERERSRTLLDELAGFVPTAGSRVDPDIVQRALSARKTVNQIAAAAWNAQADQRAALKTNFEAQLRQRTGLVELVKKQAPFTASKIAVVVASTLEIENKLGPEDALIAYSLGKQQGAAFVVRPGRITGAPVSLGAADMRRMVENFSRAMTPGQEALLAMRGQLLANLLLSPIMRDIQGVKNLYIVPCEPLTRVSFAALPTLDGRNLLQNYTIQYLTSGSSLAWAESRPWANRGECLVVSPDSTGPVPAADSFSWKKILAGQEARETVVRDGLIRQPGVIHITARALPDSYAPRKSGFLLRPDSDTDGILSAGEIMNIHPVAGLISLGMPWEDKMTDADRRVVIQAFQSGGSCAVVSLMWRINQTASDEFFQLLYEKINRLPLPDAFREAQLMLYEKYQSPGLWAGFMVHGPARP